MQLAIIISPRAPTTAHVSLSMARSLFSFCLGLSVSLCLCPCLSLCPGFVSLPLCASRVFVDGQSVLDHWGECCASWVSDDVPIAAGDHAVIFEFYENGGAAYASLSWEAAAGGASITVAGDNSYELWLNGQQQGSGDEWTTATTYSVDIDEDYLANQEAVIAIHGTDAGPPGAIIAVASQGPNTYLTGVDNWCLFHTYGIDAYQFA